MKHIIFTIFLLLCKYQASFASTPEIIDSIIKAKQLLKEGSILVDTSRIFKARNIFLKVYEKESTPENLYFVAQSEHELVRFGMAFEKSDLFQLYLDSSIARSKQLTELKPEWSEPYALLSLLYGYKIAKNHIYGVTLGPKSYYLAEDALKLNKENPRAWFVAGIVRLHMPDILGGGADEAIPFFKKAINLYEHDSVNDSLSPDWGYLDALTWLGWAYEEDDQPEEALNIYKKALSLEPRAKWIESIFIEPLKNKLDIK
jgi:tetratricopeptide (TPR) repeat protein